MLSEHICVSSKEILHNGTVLTVWRHIPVLDDSNYLENSSTVSLSHNKLCVMDGCLITLSQAEKFMTIIWEEPSSNLGYDVDCPDWGITLYLSAQLGKFPESTINWVFCTMGTRSFLGLKWPQRCAEYPLPSTAGLRMVTSTPPPSLCGHRDVIGWLYHYLKLSFLLYPFKHIFRCHQMIRCCTLMVRVTGSVVK
jgi:hypothetical protein